LVKSDLHTYKLVLLLMYWFADAVNGNLTRRPHNTVVVQGDRTLIECRPINPTVSAAWQYTNATGNPQQPIYNPDRGLNPVYGQRNITVDRYDLIFSSVSMADSGTFTCQEQNGESLAAWLTVLGKFCWLGNLETSAGRCCWDRYKLMTDVRSS